MDCACVLFMVRLRAFRNFEVDLFISTKEQDETRLFPVDLYILAFNTKGLILITNNYK